MERRNVLKLECHALPRQAARPAALGRFQAAQIGERQHGIDQRYGRHDEIVGALQIQLVVARAQNRRFRIGNARALSCLLFTFEQLVGVEIAAAQADVPARPDENRRGGGVQHSHDHAGHAAVHQPLILKHQRAIQEHRGRQHNRRAEKARVAIDRIGRQQQRDGRIEIALVHLRAKGEYHREHHRTEQEYRAAVSRFDIEPHGQAERRGIGRPRDIRPRARVAQRAPVHAQQHIEIAGVDGDIVVFVQRSGVQIPQPRERIAPLCQRERQRRGDDD